MCAFRFLLLEGKLMEGNKLSIILMPACQVSLPSASDPGNLIKIPFFSDKIQEIHGEYPMILPGKLPGISRCAKIEQDPAFPAGKSGTFKNPDRKTWKKLKPGRVSGIHQGILPGNTGTLSIFIF